ncbi:hypothetical protein GY45DRAFT_1079260 [Cubamyces sp. BRFM 1775]|nr:hypothetical protein GY45DRAFT_1079260 [Cubamyces sp. BRFM 1775]
MWSNWQRMAPLLSRLMARGGVRIASICLPADRPSPQGHDGERGRRSRIRCALADVFGERYGQAVIECSHHRPETEGRQSGRGTTRSMLPPSIIGDVPSQPLCGRRISRTTPGARGGRLGHYLSLRLIVKGTRFSHEVACLSFLCFSRGKTAPSAQRPDMAAALKQQVLPGLIRLHVCVCSASQRGQRGGS